MHLVEITPVPCLCCGRGNTNDIRKDPLRFVDLERDVNWNDPAILCEDCIGKMGGMIGLASKDVLATLNAEMRAKDKEMHELRSEIDAMKRRATKLGIKFVEPATV